MNRTGQLSCACTARPAPEAVALWERWTCPDCGREWIADEPAPQMDVEWLPAESWELLPKLTKEPWRA